MKGDISEVYCKDGSEYSVNASNTVQITAMTELVGGIPFHYEVDLTNGYRVKIFDFAKVVYK